MRRWSDERADLSWLVAAAVATVVVAQLSDPGSAGDLLLLAPAPLAFALRGLVPRLPAELFAALVVLPVAVVVAERRVLEGSFFLVVNMVLAVSWRLPSLRRSVAITVVSALAPLLVSVRMEGRHIGWQAWTAATFFTFVLGRVLRRQQVLIGQLESARHVLAEQAVAEERRRIARELHDLAGHTLAAILLHVTGARHVLRRDLDEAEQALRDAEQIGQSSLDQIRHAVARLRANERGTDPSLPGPLDVLDLVDEYERAGLKVAATLPPAFAELDGPVVTAVHRIVREALANVARHAPGNVVQVSVERGDRGVCLVIADRGRPGSAVSAEGFGIVGMRERARSLGGHLEARPTEDGWRVEAWLPLEATAT